MHEQDPAADTRDGVIAQYEALRWQHRATADALRGRQRRLIFGLLAMFAVIAGETSFSLQGARAAWPLAASFAVVIALIVLLVKVQDPIAETQRLVRLYDGNLLRVDGTTPYTELTGETALVDAGDHLYRRDLDVTGARSLFSMLATVRTGIGERGLAHYLLMPATQQETMARQEAVRELMPQTGLREQIALLGASSFQQLSAGYLDRWLEEEAPVIAAGYRYALLVTALGVVGSVVAGIVHWITWSAALENAGLLLAVQSGLALAIRDRIKPLLEGGARLQGQVRLFGEGLGLMQRTSFESARLLALQRVAREPAGAVELLKKLDGYLVIVEQRSKEYYFVLSLVTAAGSQAGISIARWKREHVAAMRQWLAAWGEFEALNALATYAFEHPAGDGEYAWPELLPAGAASEFVGEAVGHPLLPAGIRNDLAFDGDRHFLLISGSNMAGKSTLMRSIGTNAVLAYAGAPVRARSLRLTPLTLGASIALTDSLAEGKSKFLAEVERLAAIVRASERGPVLFLVDEIFSGTNSMDRRTAAGAVLARLLGNGAIGALSTHDLALTSLAAGERGGRNVHMASPDPEDPLAFDYRLKPGVNEHSNALAILRLIGLDVSAAHEETGN